MHIQFPIEVIEESVVNPEFADALKDYLAEVSPHIVNQAKKFYGYYSTMWAAFLMQSCYMSSHVAWWSGYVMLVGYALIVHLGFRCVYGYMMLKAPIEKKIGVYFGAYFIRNIVALGFALFSVVTLLATVWLIRLLTP